MTIDVSKHVKVFNPSWVTGEIGIVGVGSIGSAVALNLAKLGLISQLSLHDDDRVEVHNIANQFLYGPSDIGELKVVASRKRLWDLAGNMSDIMPSLWSDKVTKRRDIGHCKYLFVCVDSMEQRKHIFEQCVQYNPRLVYYCEGRMDATSGQVFGFNPLDMAKCTAYIQGLYPDTDVPVETGGCSLTSSIGATAMIIACHMTWHFMNTLSNDEKRKPNDEIALGIANPAMHYAGNLK